MKMYSIDFISVLRIVCGHAPRTSMTKRAGSARRIKIG